MLEINSRNAAKGVTQAIQDKDWELGAEYISKVDFSQNYDFYHGQDDPFAVLKAAQSELRGIISGLLDDAILKNNQDEIMRFVSC